DPDVRIDADLLGKIFRNAWLRGGIAQGPCPDALIAPSCGTHDGQSAVEAIELKKNCAGFLRAPPHQISGGSRGFAAPDQCLNVKAAFETDHAASKSNSCAEDYPIFSLRLRFPSRDWRFPCRPAPRPEW